MKIFMAVMFLSSAVCAENAMADGFNGSSSGSSVDLTAVTTDVKPSVDSSVNLGSSSKRWANTFSTVLTSGALTAPAATGIVLTSNVTDGASAVGVSLVSSTLANASARLVEIKEGSTTIAYWDHAGMFTPGASNTYRLGTGGVQWLEGHITTIYLYNALYTSGNFPVMLKTQASNGASANALDIDSFNAFSTTGATLAKFSNAGALKFSLSYDGSPKQAAITLQTCALGLEGTISRDSAGGGTTGHRTRLCLCTSDGAGSPAYKWKNLGMGDIPTALGTTTTCPDDVN